MLAWLTANIGTIVVSAILLVIVAAIVFSLVRRRRSGKTSCGCGCAHCALNGSCHGH